MTQYTNQVEYQRRKRHVEEWAAKCNYVLGQNGYLEMGYNSGLVTREYHDGKFEVIEPAKDFATLMQEAPSK